MHYLVDVPPTRENYTPRPWQKPHRMNMTGTPEAYRPPGSILGKGRRAPATGDVSRLGVSRHHVQNCVRSPGSRD